MQSWCDKQHSGAGAHQHLAPALLQYCKCIHEHRRSPIFWWAAGSMSSSGKASCTFTCANPHRWKTMLLRASVSRPGIPQGIQHGRGDAWRALLADSPPYRHRGRDDSAVSLVLAAQAGASHFAAAVPLCTAPVACAGLLRCLFKSGTERQCRQPHRKALWGGQAEGNGTGHTTRRANMACSCAGTSWACRVGHLRQMMSGSSSGACWQAAVPLLQHTSSPAGSRGGPPR